jgi:hypothetical protein
MGEIKPEYAIFGDTVQKIKVGDTEIPCCASVEDLDKVDSLMRSLMKYGVFMWKKGDTKEEKKLDTAEEINFEGFLTNLSEKELALIKAIDTEWMSKTEIDMVTRMKRRDFHEAFFNINRKARIFGIVKEDENLIERKFENEEFHFRLKDFGVDLKKNIR